MGNQNSMCSSVAFRKSSFTQLAKKMQQSYKEHLVLRSNSLDEQEEGNAITHTRAFRIPQNGEWLY